MDDIKRGIVRVSELVEDLPAHVTAVLEDTLPFRLAEVVEDPPDGPVGPVSPGEEMHFMGSREHLCKVRRGRGASPLTASMQGLPAEMGYFKSWHSSLPLSLASSAASWGVAQCMMRSASV